MATCEASPPESPAAALAGIASGTGSVGYLEEIRHPALLSPEIARGEMRVNADGRLVRQQRDPVAETAIIGEETVTLIGEGGGDVEILPIPADLDGFLGTLRSIAVGDMAGLADGKTLTLETDPGGWRVAVGTGAETPVLFGCGARLHGVEIVSPGGGSRVIRFHDAP